VHSNAPVMLAFCGVHCSGGSSSSLLLLGAWQHLFRLAPDATVIGAALMLTVQHKDFQRHLTAAPALRLLYHVPGSGGSAAACGEARRQS